MICAPSLLSGPHRHDHLAEVEDIESLWSHISRFRDRYKIRDLFERDYGMREFHIVDLDDCLIFVGQQIKTPEHSTRVA